MLFGSHKCNYSIPITVHGIMFLKCDYPGCTCCDTHPDQDKKDAEEMRELQNKINTLIKMRNAQE